METSKSEDQSELFADDTITLDVTGLIDYANDVFDWNNAITLSSESKPQPLTVTSDIVLREKSLSDQLQEIELTLEVLSDIINEIVEDKPSLKHRIKTSIEDRIEHKKFLKKLSK